MSSLELNIDFNPNNKHYAKLFYSVSYTHQPAFAKVAMSTSSGLALNFHTWSHMLPMGCVRGTPSTSNNSGRMTVPFRLKSFILSMANEHCMKKGLELAWLLRKNLNLLILKSLLLTKFHVVWFLWPWFGLSGSKYRLIKAGFHFQKCLVWC